MKKILLILALMLPTIVFSACEKEEVNSGNETNNALVGTWVDYDDVESIYYQFNADHSGYEWYTYQGETSEKFPFTWSTKGNVLTIVYHEDGDDDTVTFQYSINNNQLTLSELGYPDDTIVFQRVN